MKKIVIILLALALVSSLPAIDLGFGLESVSGISESGAKLGWSESLRLSGLMSFKGGDAFRFIMAGWGSLDLNGSLDPSFDMDPMDLSGNLDRFDASLRLSAADSSSLTTVHLGRISADDPAGSYSPSRVDGLSAEISTGQMDISVLGGYTGFLSAKAAGISLSAADAADIANPAVYFAAPRAFGMAGLHFVELVGPLDLSFSIGGQADLRTMTMSTLHSFWGQLLLQGPLALGMDLSASIDAALQGANLSALMPALMASLRASWASSSGLDLGLQAEWASGASGPLDAWKPMRILATGSSFTESLSGLYLAKVSADYPILDGLEASGSVAGFGLAGGIISDPDFIGGSWDWLGEEVTANLQYSPTTDLVLTLGGSVFLPSWGLAYRPSAMPRWGATLSASLEL